MIRILTAILITSSLVAGFTTPSTRISTTTSTTQLHIFGDLFKSFEAAVEAPKSSKTNIVAGATGYIGKSTVRESVRQGYNTIALVRDLEKVENAQGKALYGQFFEGATVVECDVCDAEALTKTLAKIAQENNGIDSIVSCLASRSGIKKDSYAIDYQATLNCLDAGRDPSVKARHFVLLSAYCVKRPLLQFQKAKLKFEAALTKQEDMTWSIVRPTAFFKSVSGQLEVIQSGAPFVMFGDGEVSCLKCERSEQSSERSEHFSERKRTSF